MLFWCWVSARLSLSVLWCMCGVCVVYVCNLQLGPSWESLTQTTMALDNELLTDMDTIAEHWRERVLWRALWRNKQHKKTYDTPRELPLFRSEVIKATKDTADIEAPGPDRLPIDLLKGGVAVINRMHRICTAVWESGEWPEKWTYWTSSHYQKKEIVETAITIELRWCHMQAR